LRSAYIIDEIKSLFCLELFERKSRFDGLGGGLGEGIVAVDRLDQFAFFGVDAEG
jgi:hypothetical protein